MSCQGAHPTRSLGMKRTDLFFLSMCIAAWMVTPACSSSDDAGVAVDAGNAGDDDGGSSSSRDAGNHGDSSTHDAGSLDAAKTDAGTLEGWTEETPDEAILLATGTSATKL